MQKNLNMLYFGLFLFPLLSLFCFDNLLFIWVLMEMQMMCYVCTLVLKVSKSNYLLSFVLIQLLVGVSLFYFTFLSNIANTQEVLIMLMLLINLFFKMGLYPFSSWALKFITSLSGVDYWLFLTFMKIIPLVMCFYVNNVLFLFLILTNWVYSCFILSYHSGYKKIIFFSSIANSSIFFCLFFMGFLSVAKVFLLFYFFFISMLILFLEKMNYDFIFSGKKSENSLLLMMLILSLVGMPFLWGFVVKTIFMMSLFYSNAVMLYFLMFMVSLVFSFYYMKLIFFFFMSNNHWSSSLGFLFLNEKPLVYYGFLIMFPLMATTFLVLGSNFFF